MSPPSESDRLLIKRVRVGEATAWEELIDRYEGRLLAFIRQRLGRPTQAEDVVQETFIGFLASLPNYDEARPLESYLFTIAAHKLTDHLRREGRRPTVSFSPESDDGEDDWQFVGRGRAASSLFRGQEQQRIEEAVLAQALDEQLSRSRERGDWEKIKCLELLFVRGWANKNAAARLGLSEQKVANYKHEFLSKLRQSVQRLGLANLPGVDEE
ncbi:MAG: sigma-70 family RNA polymerase sigma factor [Planctomycetales bacterium]